LALVSELGRAIREGELVLHFQPRVHLASGAVVGFEALVRWSHPRLGLLAPAQFLPFAEASDLIHPLTYWVVEAALLQLHRWDAERSGLTMGINLSVRNLLDRGCASRLEKIIRSVGVDPSRVEFELTETAIMSDPEAAVTMLGRITSSGARLAIDDFGTGFSSLAHLTRFPVHVIKVDQSFVSGMTTGKQNLAIVRLTVHLARSLGLQVIAEGVEDRQTALVLRDMGCDMAQGFLFARPAPADEVGSRLAATGWQLDTAGPAPF
jgi:EAL domain-containing protein (putative c-di-GMP-specific phosphodiesterase class I)